MKKLFLLFIMLMPILVFSQTKLDSILFEKINEYRIYNNVNPISWNYSTYRAADHHVNYMISNKRYSYYEDTIINGTSLEDSNDRLWYYMGHKKYYSVECIARHIKNFKSKEILDSNYDEITNSILRKFIENPVNNKNILDDRFELGAVSIKHISTPVNIKDWTNFDFIVSFIGVVPFYNVDQDIIISDYFENFKLSIPNVKWKYKALDMYDPKKVYEEDIVDVFWLTGNLSGPNASAEVEVLIFDSEDYFDIIAISTCCCYREIGKGVMAYDIVFSVNNYFDYIVVYPTHVVLAKDMKKGIFRRTKTYGVIGYKTK
jgi:hypothetical protein